MFTLPELPYAKDTLVPHMSAETFDFHHGKHHQAYVDNLNKLIPGTEFEGMDLEKIIQTSDGGIFNNAAQIWNHTFFWNSMSPNGGGAPTGKIAELIESNFESLENFKAEFVNAAATLFGSGWIFLVQDGESLSIEKYTNADSPVAHGKNALLTLDVWEHAYYLDYQNARPGFANAFLDNLINWEFANSQIV